MKNKHRSIKKILYISGTRADYGLMRETLFSIKKDPYLSLQIIVTGMHLMPEFGKTVNEIKKDGFEICLAPVVFKSDNHESAVIFIGQFIEALVNKVRKLKPDLILLLGDRPEMLAAAMVGAYEAIPVAHIHGGDVSSTIDDSARHAITKFSHIHFPATKKSAERILKMGEEGWRVHMVGAPGLDGILHTKLISPDAIAKIYGLDKSRPVLLVVQHPVTTEIQQAKFQMEQTMVAIKKMGHQAVVIYPNADAGGSEMIKAIERYRSQPNVKIYKNIPRIHYLSLLKIANVLVGNSSSGIIEAASFKLPVVNIGSRQDGRERAGNVIDVEYNERVIQKAIRTALYDKHFIGKVRRIKSPYGDGKTSARITKILKNIVINKKLLEKKLSY